MKKMKEEKGLRLSLIRSTLIEKKGFTLIELVVAMVLSFILIGAIYGTFTSQQKSYTVQDQVAETQQNARMAMNILMRDIRMAGYGMPEGGISIGQPAKTYSNAIGITKNDQKHSFDSITLVGAFGAPSGYLDRTLSAGSTEIFLRSSGEGSHFDTNDKQYIFIGGIDKLKVTGVVGKKITLNGGTSARYPTGILSVGVNGGDTDIHLVSASGLVSGDMLNLGMETLTITAIATNTLTVDTDPGTAGNQGITGTYPAGTIINPIPVFRVTAVEYTIDANGNFTRADRAVGTVAELAGNIQDIQISPDDQADEPWYDITLTARTRKPDPDYTQNEGRRQRVLQSRVALRNL
jgi:prepilin-type N-terminal cleavage/methylation domain-containing protein